MNWIKKIINSTRSRRVEALINPIILIRHKKDTYSSNYFLALHNEGEWDLVKICTVVTTVSLKDHRWDPEFTKVVAVLLVYLQDILFRKWLRKLDSHHEQCWQIDHPKLWTNSHFLRFSIVFSILSYFCKFGQKSQQNLICPKAVNVGWTLIKTLQKSKGDFEKLSPKFG